MAKEWPWGQEEQISIESQILIVANPLFHLARLEIYL
jgi:hypothetical protein